METLALRALRARWDPLEREALKDPLEPPDPSEPLERLDPRAKREPLVRRDPKDPPDPRVFQERPLRLSSMRC